MRYFNTEGACRPDIHYMVRLDDRLEKIKQLYIDRGKYFVINRGRQYGKTTTFMALVEYLKTDYVVIPMDFQMMSTANFANGQIFARKFIELIERYFSKKQERRKGIDLEAFQTLTALKEKESLSMDMLFERLSNLCETAEKPVVMMIDEADSALNSQVFLDFLALLRGYYLNREDFPFFHSVVLAGVHDIQNLELKTNSEKEYRYNSPWNIAADFTIDMDFSLEQIADMLNEYEKEKHTGMDTKAVSKLVYEYTSGHPYLVSAVCQLLDEVVSEVPGFEGVDTVWTRIGIVEAVKILLRKTLPLFQNMIRQFGEYPDLKQMLDVHLFQGKRISFNMDIPAIGSAATLGYLVNKEGSIQVANRIFEMYLYDYFLTEEELTILAEEERMNLLKRKQWMRRKMM